MTGTYAHVLSHLFSRSAMGMRMGLETTRALLVALSRPDEAFEHIIVAGTNGKGSTSCLLSQALTEAGHTTGLYTSPHLCSYTERIRVNGAAIPEHTVVRLLAELEAAEARTGLRASFFEASTLLACLYFRERQVTMAIIECGLGGRLDATNALTHRQRRMCIITPISLDHQAILGPDCPTIAKEKAAIMRAHVPTVVAPQDQEVMKVLRHHASAVGSPLREVPPTTGPLESLSQDPMRPNLPGYLQHNAEVAEVARVTLNAIGVPCPKAAMDLTVRTFSWPGRYQKLPAKQSTGPSYLIDGSHNAAGMEAFCRTVRADGALVDHALHAVFGVMPHKDGAALRAQLSQLTEHIYPCSIALARSSEAAAHLPTAPALLHKLENILGPEDVIVVVGSLYLAGEALSYIGEMPSDPPVLG